MNFKLGLKTTAAAIALAASAAANANLIENGSFEDPALSGNQWQVFDSIPGWQTLQGAGIEIQRETVVQTPWGDQYVELDSHGSDSNTLMVQEINGLVAGAKYDFSFWYHARTDYGFNDNGIDVYWGGPTINDPAEVLSIENKKRSDGDGWVNYTLSLVADYETMFIGFAADGRQNTLGGFIDNVSLTAVPEPATLGLFGLGIAGLGLARRKAK